MQAEKERQRQRDRDGPVVLLLDKVVPCPECHQVCVVRRRRDGHTARAADVRVAQLVGQHLKVVGGKMIVIPQYVIVRRPTCTLTGQHKHAQHLRRTECYWLHCALSLVAQCIVIGPVCGFVCL